MAGEGYLRCTVYYQSDEAGAQLYRIEQKFPFEKTADLPEGRYETGPAAVSGELEYVNCRAISEHRIDLRGAYALCVAVQMVDQLELVTSLADCGIEQRTRVLNGRACAAVEEKTFTAESRIPLPAGDAVVLDISGVFLPEAATVLTGQVNCQERCASRLPSGPPALRRSPPARWNSPCARPWTWPPRRKGVSACSGARCWAARWKPATATPH